MHEELCKQCEEFFARYPGDIPEHCYTVEPFRRDFFLATDFETFCDIVRFTRWTDGNDDYRRDVVREASVDINHLIKHWRDVHKEYLKALPNAESWRPRQYRTISPASPSTHEYGPRIDKQRMRELRSHTPFRHEEE